MFVRWDLSFFKVWFGVGLFRGCLFFIRDLYFRRYGCWRFEVFGFIGCVLWERSWGWAMLVRKEKLLVGI